MVLAYMVHWFYLYGNETDMGGDRTEGVEMKTSEVLG
jgi:hypothetical protein